MQDTTRGPLRVALAGAGSGLALEYAGALRDSRDARLVALVGDLGAPPDWQSELGPDAPLHKRVEQLDPGLVDAVIVCAPLPELAARALALGFPVLGAAPLARREQDALRLFEAATRRGVHVASGLPWRHAFASVEAAVQEGLVGVVTRVEVAWHRGSRSRSEEVTPTEAVASRLLAPVPGLLRFPLELQATVAGSPEEAPSAAYVDVRRAPVGPIAAASGPSTLLLEHPPTAPEEDRHVLVVTGTDGRIEALAPNDWVEEHEAARAPWLPRLRILGWGGVPDALGPSPTVSACFDRELARFVAGVRRGAATLAEVEQELLVLRLLAGARRSAADGEVTAIG